MAALDRTKSSPSKEGDHCLTLSFTYFLNKDYNSTDDGRTNDKGSKINTLHGLAQLESDIKELLEPDDGDVHNVVACRRLKRVFNK